MIFFLGVDQLILCYPTQWLVTKRAKEHWKKYKAMVDEAKAKTEISAVELPCSPQEVAGIAGTSSLFNVKKISSFLFKADITFNSSSLKYIFTFLGDDTDHLVHFSPYCIIIFVSFLALLYTREVCHNM